MRTRLKNHNEVAHVWAQQNQSEGRAGNMFFDGPSIFSYGRHFEIARFHGPRLVLFTSRGYSNSTAHHKSITRRAVSHCNVFEVPSVSGDHIDNMKYFFREAMNLRGKALRATKYGSQFAHDAKKTLEIALHYSRTFKMDYAKYSAGVPSPLFPKDTLEKMEEKRQREEKRSQERWEKKREREEKERQERIAKAKENLKEWLEGHNPAGAFNLGYYLDKIYLRVNGENIQTTKGAEIPLTVARKLWERIKENKPLAGMSLGHYTVDTFDGEILTVGCHTISLSEMQRLAAILGW
jgi:hypothetical protein